MLVGESMVLRCTTVSSANDANEYVWIERFIVSLLRCLFNLLLRYLATSLPWCITVHYFATSLFRYLATSLPWCLVVLLLHYFKC